MISDESKCVRSDASHPSPSDGQGEVAPSTAQTFYIVWNERGDEGAVFKDQSDAIQCLTGEFDCISSTLANEFYEIYEDDNRSIQEVDLSDTSDGAMLAWFRSRLEQLRDDERLPMGVRNFAMATLSEPPSGTPRHPSDGEVQRSGATEHNQGGDQ